MCVALFESSALWHGRESSERVESEPHLSNSVERFKKNVISLKDYLNTETYQKVEFAKHILDTNPFLQGVFFMTEQVYYYNTRTDAFQGASTSAGELYNGLKDGWNEPMYDPYTPAIGGMEEKLAVIHYVISGNTSRTDTPYKIGFTIPFNKVANN